MVTSRRTTGHGRLLVVNFLILLLSLCRHDASASPSRFNLGFFGYSTQNKTAPQSATNGGDKRQWSALLTVDPAKIIGLLIHRGGLVLPKYVQDELVSTSKVCAVDAAQLNVMDRKIEFTNFTVALPGSPKALRVGRLLMTWDSYLKPCVDIELDDVDLLVEFTNLLLTKTNWNELQNAGFPPATTMATSDEPKTSSVSSTFLRIGSIDLSGAVKAKLRSRPLDRDIAPILVFDLDSLDVLNEEIKKCSDVNLSQTGRRGCTTNELYGLIQAFVADKIRTFVASTAYDLVTNPFQDDETGTVRDLKRILSGAASTILSYASDATRVKGKHIHQSVTARLENIGLPDPGDKLEHLKSLSESVAAKWGIPPDTMSKLKCTFETATEATRTRIAEAKGAESKKGAKSVAKVVQQQHRKEGGD